MQSSRHNTSYDVLASDLKTLKHDFNSHAGSVRVIYIVSATCPECLHGMAVLAKALRAERGNPGLRTYIVYVPALGAAAKDIQPTVGLMPGNYVHRYWDPHGVAGHDFENILGITQFAWDVYMIYGPNQTWSTDLPPKPRFWMHQLNGLSRERFLNADVFADQVQRMLAHARPVAASGSGP